MAEAASSWGSEFEPVTVRPEKSRLMRPRGLLSAFDDLEEITLSSAQAVAGRARGNVRAFLVRGSGLADAGLRPGDHLLIDAARDLFVDPLVLGKSGSRYRLEIASRLRVSAEPVEILGAFIGILRRRGFASRGCVPPSFAPLSVHPPTRLGILRSQLDMLETTCATTRNPRLRRALKDEADRVRKQLQTGTEVD